jgi:hypothetical protein
MSFMNEDLHFSSINVRLNAAPGTCETASPRSKP